MYILLLILITTVLLSTFLIGSMIIHLFQYVNKELNELNDMKKDMIDTFKD